MINTLIMCNLYNIEGDPFSKLSAEEELDVLNEIYFKPHYYNELVNLAKQGHSRFILGQRGDGKSATIYKLKDDLLNGSTLPILITRYDNFPPSQNVNYFLYAILRELTLTVAKSLFEDNKKTKLLNGTQKSQISLFIEIFYDNYCSEQFVASAQSIKRKKTYGWLVKLFNRGLRLINEIINKAASLTVDSIQRYIGVPGESEISGDVLTEFDVPEIKAMSMEEVVGWGKDRLIRAIKRMIEIANSIGYKTIIVLFDKIDEYSIVNTDVERVAEFTFEILTDTDFLYSKNLAIVFSLWSEVKNSLGSKGVRYDKFKCIDIRWTREELEKLIDKRLEFYSVDKNQPVQLRSLVSDDNTKNEILDVSYRSPRSLINMLGCIYNEDNRENIISFSPSAISRGMIKFCKEFDYESLLPSRLGKSTDLINWIDKVLAIKRVNFSLKEASQALGQTQNTTQQYVDYLKKISIIKDSPISDESGKPRYDVLDPKIKFLISRGITSLDR